MARHLGIINIGRPHVNSSAGSTPAYEDLSLSRFRRGQEAYQYLLSTAPDYCALVSNSPVLGNSDVLGLKLNNLKRAYNSSTYFKYALLVETYFTLVECTQLYQEEKELLRGYYIQKETQCKGSRACIRELHMLLYAREYIEGKLASFTTQYKLLVQGFASMGIAIEDDVALLKLAGGESEDFKLNKNTSR